MQNIFLFALEFFAISSFCQLLLAIVSVYFYFGSVYVGGHWRLDDWSLSIFVPLVHTALISSMSASAMDMLVTAKQSCVWDPKSSVQLHYTVNFGYNGHDYKGIFSLVPVAKINANSVIKEIGYKEQNHLVCECPLYPKFTVLYLPMT